MTNFEKWKEGLTPERLYALMYYFEAPCEECPAAQDCHKRAFCQTEFLKWASKESEND